MTSHPPCCNAPFLKCIKADTSLKIQTSIPSVWFQSVSRCRQTNRDLKWDPLFQLGKSLVWQLKTLPIPSRSPVGWIRNKSCAFRIKLDHYAARVCACMSMCMMLGGGGVGWSREDANGLSLCFRRANPSHIELSWLACPEQSHCMKALSRDAENTARLLRAANKDLLHRERWERGEDCEMKSMGRTRWMRFCFCNNPFWNSQNKTSGQNVVVLPCPITQSAFSPSFQGAVSFYWHLLCTYYLFLKHWL